MRSRLVRSGVTAAALGPFVMGGLAPPAHATTSMLVKVVGTMVLAAPLGDPCIGPGGTADPLLCTTRHLNMHPTNGDFVPTALTVMDLPLPGDPVPQGHIDYHHNKTNIAALFSITCVNVVSNLNKPGKAFAHAGACGLGLGAGTLPNTIAGDCKNMSGQVILFFTDALGQTHTFDLHITGAAEKLVLTGHSKKVGSTQSGLVVGTLKVVPPNKATQGTGCTNKTARQFGIVGTFVGAG
jgi:hypothetical protein